VDRTQKHLMSGYALPEKSNHLYDFGVNQDLGSKFGNDKMVFARLIDDEFRRERI